MNQRVRVTSPQTRLAQRRGTDAKGRLSRLSGRPPLSSLTAIDLDAAERALHRQRGLAVRTAATLAISLAVLLMAAVLTPGRLSWAVLFFAPYPVLLTLAALHVRRAELIEAEHGDHAGDSARANGAARNGIGRPDTARSDTDRPDTGQSDRASRDHASQHRASDDGEPHDDPSHADPSDGSPSNGSGGS